MIILLLLLLCLAWNTIYAFYPLTFKSQQQHRHHRSLLSANTDSTSSDIKSESLGRATFLRTFWETIVHPDDSGEPKELMIQDFGVSKKIIPGLLEHFQVCKDCAADEAFMQITQGGNAVKLSRIGFNVFNHDEDDDWDDDDNIAGYDGEQIENEKTVFPIEEDDNVILRDSKEWVRAMIADFGICPFTIDPERAGIPMGGVRYTVSRSKDIDEAFLRYWEEVEALLSSSEKEMATILLIFPEIELFGNFELFEAYCDTLSDALETIDFEKEIQLVFFHPKYQFRDGQARAGEDMGAANFARRAPWPMINILRTPQVRAAQKGIPTGLVYKQNEERLSEVGAGVLEKMLYDRKWEGLPAHSAHAKSMRVREENIARANEQKQVEKCPVKDITENTSSSSTPSNAGKCPVIHTPENNENEKTVEFDENYYINLANDVEAWLESMDNE